MQYNKRDVCINEEFEYIFIKDFNDDIPFNTSDDYNMKIIVENIINKSLLLRLHYILYHVNHEEMSEKSHNYCCKVHSSNYMNFEFINILGFNIYITIQNKNRINKKVIMFNFNQTNTHFTSIDDTINLFKSILIKNNLIDKLINLKLNNFIYNII